MYEASLFGDTGAGPEGFNLALKIISCFPLSYFFNLGTIHTADVKVTFEISIMTVVRIHSSYRIRNICKCYCCLVTHRVTRYKIMLGNYTYMFG